MNEEDSRLAKNAFQSLSSIKILQLLFAQRVEILIIDEIAISFRELYRTRIELTRKESRNKEFTQNYKILNR